MTSINPNDIYLKVTDTYRAVALDSSACCGTNTSCCGSDLYDIDLSGAPADAVASSRGCGNPQAIAALLPGNVCSTSVPAGDWIAFWRLSASGQPGGSMASI